MSSKSLGRKKPQSRRPAPVIEASKPKTRAKRPVRPSANGASREGRALVHMLANAIGATRLHLFGLRHIRDEAERNELLTAAETATAAGAEAVKRLRSLFDRMGRMRGP